MPNYVITGSMKRNGTGDSDQHFSEVSCKSW